MARTKGWLWPSEALLGAEGPGQARLALAAPIPTSINGDVGRSPHSHCSERSRAGPLDITAASTQRRSKAQSLQGQLSRARHHPSVTIPPHPSHWESHPPTQGTTGRSRYQKDLPSSLPTAPPARESEIPSTPGRPPPPPTSRQ